MCSLFSKMLFQYTTAAYYYLIKQFVKNVKKYYYLLLFDNFVYFTDEIIEKID